MFMCLFSPGKGSEASFWMGAPGFDKVAHCCWIWLLIVSCPLPLLHPLLQILLFPSMKLGNVSETPTPTTCLKSTAVHLQFVRQYAPHLYCRTFLASKLRRKGNPAIRLPFVRQYAPHLYGNTPPICTAVLLEKYWGLGSPERF